METRETNQGGYIGSEKIAEPKSQKGLGMTLTEAIGELEKGHKITCDEAPEGRYCYLKGDKLFNSNTQRWCSFEEFKNEIPKDDKNVWRIYEPKLKNATQQKRVELIEKQKNELIAATATIDNLKLDVKTLAERAETIINDLSFRNGNLTRITNDQTERIEVMQNELKNYESVLDLMQEKVNKHKALEVEVAKRNLDLCDHIEAARESRERLASKFTNWFIFLVLTNIVSIAWGVYQLLTK